MYIRLYFLFIFLLLSSFLYGDELTTDPPTIWEANCIPCRPADFPPPRIPADWSDNVIVDLVDPIYEDGVLTTTQGGVLSAPNLRIQAQNITYTRQLDGEFPIFTVYCEGKLLIDYNEYVLVGESIYYDFMTQRGFLTLGKTAAPPWYIGGREILLMEKGLVVVVDGFISTSEGETQDLMLCASCITLTPNKVITASNIKAKVNQVPVFWFPKLQIDLNNIGRSPFAVKYGWGGFLGSYVSVLYRFLSWREFIATARLDAFFGKGMGAGIETVYNPSFRPTQWYSRNYYAHDIPLNDPKRRDRYRLQGTFYDRVYGIVIDGMYDFVSDAEMASDYTTKDFDLKTAGRTQLELRRKNPSWIANLFTRVRVNDFQSVNQELPSFRLHMHPLEIPSTGVIFENTFKVSYLDYVFSDDVVGGIDFAAGRIACYPTVYRPTLFGPIAVTPEAGLVGIGYSNTPGGDSKGLVSGRFGVKLETALSKHSAAWKHVAEPYLHYTYLTSPTIGVDEHYIFSILDGWNRLNMLRFGVRNSVFVKTLFGCGIERPLWVDLWANAFFHTATIPLSIPRGYWNVEYYPYAWLFIGLDGAWHFREKQLDFFNIRADWTINENVAFGVEYRHRSRFDWRKADFYNFILESTRPQEELLDSPLSEKRNTFLFRTFLRPTPTWTAKLDVRSGWGQQVFNPNLGLIINQPAYFEYLIELTRIIYQHWRLTFRYEKRESDNRYSFSLVLDPGPPPRRKACL